MRYFIYFLFYFMALVLVMPIKLINPDAINPMYFLLPISFLLFFFLTLFLCRKEGERGAIGKISAVGIAGVILPQLYIRITDFEGSLFSLPEPITQIMAIITGTIVARYWILKSQENIAI